MHVRDGEGVNTMEALEERIIELEIRSSFQAEKLEALSDALYAQQKEIDRLTARLTAAERRTTGGDEGGNPAHEKPPHY